jgi:endonuclease YncB( thermonuclease family)
MQAQGAPQQIPGHAQNQMGGQQPQQGPLLPKIMGDFRELKVTNAHAHVSDIIDGVTIEVDDKTKVRLSGIWVPWESDADPGEPVRKAMALLKKVATDRYVRLYQTRDDGAGRMNRLGQSLAQVERDDGLWLQGILLYAGLATVMTSESNPEMAARMYAIEADARKRKAGLWADPRWGVLAPDQTRDYANQYRIVEGRVFSTAMRNNVFYINFSRDWRTDFTVMVPTDKRLAFAKQGINLMGLNGKTIRVRGWIRTQNGPMIEITHPQQIEVVN